jgi:Xaa-Pro dipeptidase
MFRYQRLLDAIRRESLAGWLFYNQHHHDEIADRILAVDKRAVNTRPWVYLCFARGEPVKLVHVIEANILDHLPGRTIVYHGREEFTARLAELGGAAAGTKGHWGADFSERFPRLSFLDHGFAHMLQNLGFILQSAETLIPAVLSELSDEEIASHEEASRALHAVIGLVWERIEAAIGAGQGPIGEGDVHGWIMELFNKYNLETDGPLIVGAGKNTSLPHYFPQGKGETLARGQVVQLDIWGKLKAPGAIYADISWVGVLDRAAHDNVARAFRAVCEARDRTVELIADNLARGEQVSGAAADQCAEASLVAAGYGDFIRHRTGHSIDTEVHGFGINLDSREFPDARPLANGSCFSVEPGVYLGDFGIRSEIFFYKKNQRPVISGGAPQRELLLLKE